MADTAFIKTFTELPSIGTACGPAMKALVERFGPSYRQTSVPDSFCLFQKADGTPQDLKAVLIAHVDEIGGCVYGPNPDGGFMTRVWGNTADIFHNHALQAFDWLTEDSNAAFPVTSELAQVGDELRLILHGERVKPYRTGFTFIEETRFEGDEIHGKALDPRITAVAVAEAVRKLDSKHVGALFVMAEECAMDVVRKAVFFLQANAPNLTLIANADVPSTQSLGEARIELPAIRIFEGRNFIDPSFGIRMADKLAAQGVEFHLSAARSGSQTIYFTPLAPTLSIALPSEGVHLPSYKMSLQGTERCIALLEAIGTTVLT